MLIMENIIHLSAGRTVQLASPQLCSRGREYAGSRRARARTCTDSARLQSTSPRPPIIPRPKGNIDFSWPRCRSSRFASTTAHAWPLLSAWRLTKCTGQKATGKRRNAKREARRYSPKRFLRRQGVLCPTASICNFCWTLAMLVPIAAAVFSLVAIVSFLFPTKDANADSPAPMVAPDNGTVLYATPVPQFFPEPESRFSSNSTPIQQQLVAEPLPTMHEASAEANELENEPVNRPCEPENEPINRSCERENEPVNRPNGSPVSRKLNTDHPLNTILLRPPPGSATHPAPRASLPDMQYGPLGGPNGASGRLPPLPVRNRPRKPKKQPRASTNE